MSPFKRSTMTDKKIFTELTFATVAVYLQCRGIPLGNGSCCKKGGLIVFNFSRYDEYVYRSYGVRFAEGVDKQGCQTIEFCKIYVPSGSYSKYNSTSPYKNYTIVEE